MSPESLPNHSNRRVSDPILAQIDRTQLLLHLDPLSQRLNELFVEVVEPEVDPLELIVLLQLTKHRAHPVEIPDVVVFESELSQLRPVLQVLQDLLNHGAVYDLVLHRVGSRSL